MAFYDDLMTRERPSLRNWLHGCEAAPARGTVVEERRGEPSRCSEQHHTRCDHDLADASTHPVQMPAGLVAGVGGQKARRPDPPVLLQPSRLRPRDGVRVRRTGLRR